MQVTHVLFFGSFLSGLGLSELEALELCLFLTYFLLLKDLSLLQLLAAGLPELLKVFLFFIFHFFLHHSLLDLVFA
jgi:hypothetical protein